jgi:CO/xanthine dehydrogenase Mo-binding subunit
MPGTPVKLLWSREEDMTQGRYHPVTQCKLTGAFDADNNLIGLHMRISGQSITASVTPEALKDGMDPFTFQGVASSGEAFANIGPARLGYTIPHLLIDHSMRNPHVPPGVWRGVNGNQNGIYLECFMDELAHSAGQDPLAFRRKLMANHPEASRRPQCGRGACRLEPSPRLKGVSRYRPADGARKLRRLPPPKSPSLTVTRSKCIASLPPPIPAPSSIRRRSSGRSPALRIWSHWIVLWRLHGQGRPHRADQLRHL